MRYNGYPAAEINGAPGPGYSSGQAEAAMAKIADSSLPRGMSYEWTDLTFQRILAGNTIIYVGPLCILLVFLVLAALYESFRFTAGDYFDCADVPFIYHGCLVERQR